MKTQMLILKGTANSGKSTTIKITFDLFLQWAIKKRAASTVHYCYLTPREVAAAIQIGDEYVGIASRGDSEAGVNEGLVFFKKYGCKVVVCATRSSGKPLNAARLHSSSVLGVSAKEVLKVNVVGVAAQATANLTEAKRLLSWLKSGC